MMTRKHYIAIANVLSGIPNYTLKQGIVESIANILNSENDRFNKDKFVKALC